MPKYPECTHHGTIPQQKPTVSNIKRYLNKISQETVLGIRISFRDMANRMSSHFNLSLDLCIKEVDNWYKNSQ